MNSPQRPKLTAADVISGRDPVFFINDSAPWRPTTLKPLVKEEVQWRAESFSSLIYSHCREQIEQLLKKAEHGIVLQLTHRHASLNLEPALKILTCVSIHLAGIECGGVENPEWFINFLFQSLRAADSRCSLPSARPILEKFGSMRPDVMSLLAAQAAMKELNIEQVPIIEALSETLYKDDASRLDILKLALTGQKNQLIRAKGTNFLEKLASTVS